MSDCKVSFAQGTLAREHGLELRLTCEASCQEGLSPCTHSLYLNLRHPIGSFSFDPASTSCWWSSGSRSRSSRDERAPDMTTPSSVCRNAGPVRFAQSAWVSVKGSAGEAGGCGRSAQ